MHQYIITRSIYSTLDGLSTAKEIMERCQCIGCESVGLTDHGTVAGHLEFAKQAKAHDIKPILGCELYHGKYDTREDRRAAGLKGSTRDSAHLVAVASTDLGLRNLWSLVSEAHRTNFFFHGRVNWNLLKEYNEGLIVTSGCIQGLVAQDVLNEGTLDPLNRYLDIFGDRFYMEIHTYPGEEHEYLNTELVAVARERGIPLIYATDAHMASPDQYDTHDAYVAMQTGETILTDPADRKMWHPKSLYIQDEDQIRQSLSYLPDDVVDEALANSAELADRCDVTLPEVGRHLPDYIPANSKFITKESRKLDAATLLLELVEEGLVKRYGEDAPDKVWDRASTELKVFLDGGLEHYFLQAWDFGQWCDENNIERGPGRGSAAGAIISYALGITDIDPLRFGLFFERFYNAGREKGFPDIDSDFPTSDRPKLKKYMERKWGENKVIQIGTVTRLKPLSAIEKAHKVCGISYSDMEDLKKIVHEVPDIDILGADSIGWSEEADPGKTIYVMDHVGKEVDEWIEERNYSDLAERMVKLVEAICSRVSGYGIHPSGVVVSDVELKSELPGMWNANQKTLATMFPMRDVDARGFVKQDFLGLANLDILAEWKSLVKEYEVEGLALGEDGEIDWDKAEEECPDEMWTDIFDSGMTLGCFQIEDGYARHLVKELKPRSIEDLGIIVALNRPGPIRSGAPDSFIARKQGKEEVTYDHPILEPILEETYGWFLYQENVIQFFSALGYNLNEADAVRSILGKKKPEEMKNLYNGRGEWKGKGYQTMADGAGIDKESAEIIWSKIEDFAKYSFNKAHAIAYAALTFRTGYAKYMSAPHFVISCIRVATNQKKPKSDIGDYVSEARLMDIPVSLPSISKSQEEISYVDGEIVYGFCDIKGIGSKTAASFICDLRDSYPVRSPEDLYVAIEVRQEIWKAAKDKAKEDGIHYSVRSPRQVLSQNRLPALEKIGCYDEYIDRDITLDARQGHERELLGLVISDNSEEVLEDNAELLTDLDDYSAVEENGYATIVGIVSSIDPKKVKATGKSMGIVTVEHQGQQIEFVVFSKEWRSYRFLWKERSVAIFDLKAGDRGPVFSDGQQLRAKGK